ncbi:MAG: hypothetical protein M1824_004660 [Vezdaea acicularis]|nr:MAG: hypothetical protein M1824_004660 [Vezdaea acicularis]
MRRELIVGHGLPFGSISIGLSITNISVLWSKEFLGTCLARFNSLRKKWFLLVMIVVCAILGVTVGPASATAMKPQLDDWKAGGTSLWLNTTIDQLWPQQLNSTYILDGACQTAGSNDACPSTGWDAFGEGYATFWPGLEVEPGVWRALPRYVRVPAKDSVLELQVGASDQNLYSISPTMTTMPQAVIADAISASGELWPVAAWTVTQLGKTRFQYRQSSTYNIGAIQPATRIKCNVTYGRDTPSFPLWGDDTLVPYTSDPLQESIKNELNRTDLALNWIELPGDQFESSSIGVVVTIPVGRGGLDLIACNVDARWMNLTTTSGTEIGPRMVASSLNVYNSTLDWGNSSKRVIIGPDWAQYLNPIDPTTNKSTFNTLAAEAGIGTNQPITVATPVIVESLLALMITNGLSRVGYNSTIQGDLKPELVWEEQFLPASGKVFGYGQHAYEIDPELRKGYMPLQLTVTVRGYAYGTNGAAIITSLVVLLTYSALAIAHSIWIICFSRMSSNSWETISEVTALAMNSPPTSALRNTCAGISTIQTFSQRVRILAVSDHLEMAFVDHDDSEIGGTAVEPNRYYGNKQDLETSDLRRSRLKCT